MHKADERPRHATPPRAACILARGKAYDACVRTSPGYYVQEAALSLPRKQGVRCACACSR
jgi:hypothetical protein